MKIVYYKTIFLFHLAVTDMNPRVTFIPYIDWTCLHNAAVFDRLDVFQYISENVSNINPQAKGDRRKVTPLHLAAQYGNFEICKLIIDAIEDLSPKDHDNYTPYDYARRKGYSDICFYIDKVRNQRNGGNLMNTDESMLKAEGGWPYKNMHKFFPSKKNDPAKSKVDEQWASQLARPPPPPQSAAGSSSCVIS